MSRHLARETAMCLIFEREYGSTEPKMREQLSHDFKLSQTDEEYISVTVDGVAANITAIDEIITRYAEGWSLERICRVDLAIMRLAIYELLFAEGDIPAEIAINEAVEIAKKYSTPQSPQYINGVLDTVYKKEKK